jgi:hypothetical protein
MSTATDLRDALNLKAAELTDDLAELECLDMIERWYAARVAIAALESNEIASYSIAGRTFASKDTPSLAEHVAQLYAQIKSLLFGGGVVLVDLSAPDSGRVWL